MFKFTIRELMLLTAIAALAVGWTISARENQRMRMESQRVRKANARIWSAYTELHELAKPINDEIYYPPYGGFKTIRLLSENPALSQSDRQGNQR